MSKAAAHSEFLTPAAADESPKRWFQQPAGAALTGLSSAVTGLSTEEALRRREQSGPNVVPGGPGRTWPKILLAHLAGILSGILLATVGFSIVFGDHVDAGVILAILVLNATLGFRQEYQAERAMAALQRLAAQGELSSAGEFGKNRRGSERNATLSAISNANFGRGVRSPGLVRTRRGPQAANAQNPGHDSAQAGSAISRRLAPGRRGMWRGAERRTVDLILECSPQCWPRSARGPSPS